MVRNRGGITHLEWTGKFDGNDYPVQGVELVLTNAYRRVDDRTYELIQKIDGEVVATARLTHVAGRQDHHHRQFQPDRQRDHNLREAVGRAASQ